EEIKIDFNDAITTLVNGLTKLTKLDFESREESDAANIKRNLLSITKDIRIIYIKLADRLHNMQTLDFMPDSRKKAIAFETENIYIPLARHLGLYQIKDNLQDLCLFYLNNSEYRRACAIRKTVEEKYNNDIKLMLIDLKKLFVLQSIPIVLKETIKNPYGIYEEIQNGKKIEEIQNLIALKAMVNQLMDCYVALGIIHTNYFPVPNTFTDYIAAPKYNGYRSINTSVLTPGGKMIQFRIRTNEMDRNNALGIASKWDESMQAKVNSFNVFSTLLELNNTEVSNKSFVMEAKEEVLQKTITVKTPKGKSIQLKEGSTILDFAYSLHTQIGIHASHGTINGIYNDLGTVLKDGDIVYVITDDLLCPNVAQVNDVSTILAKRKIREYCRKKKDNE
ncbi:MAG: HD domain-containing protein, partial [Bacilli bacterium]